LSQNYLTNVDTLSKCKFSELSQIYFENNKCIKFSKTGSCFFKKTHEFALEFDKKDPNALESVNDLAKLQMVPKAMISK
jgi:hypothetical protein